MVPDIKDLYKLGEIVAVFLEALAGFPTPRIP
jgi:hypothetical protein